MGQPDVVIFIQLDEQGHQRLIRNQIERSLRNHRPVGADGGKERGVAARGGEERIDSGLILGGGLGHDLEEGVEGRLLPLLYLDDLPELRLVRGQVADYFLDVKAF